MIDAASMFTAGKLFMLTQYMLPVALWAGGMAVLAQSPVPDIAKWVGDFGLSIALVIYFVWQSYLDKQAAAKQRDDDMARAAAREQVADKRINDLEEFCRTTLLERERISSDALIRAGDSEARLAQSVEKLSATWAGKPCAAETLSQQLAQLKEQSSGDHN